MITCEFLWFAILVFIIFAIKWAYFEVLFSGFVVSGLLNRLVTLPHFGPETWLKSRSCDNWSPLDLPAKVDYKLLNPSAAYGFSYTFFVWIYGLVAYFVKALWIVNAPEECPLLKLVWLIYPTKDLLDFTGVARGTIVFVDLNRYELSKLSIRN